MNSSPPAHLHGLCVCTHCLSLPSGTAHELHGYTPIHLLGSKFSLFALASRPFKIWLILVFLTMSPELSFSVPKVWSHWFSCWASCMSSLFLPQHLCVSCYFCESPLWLYTNQWIMGSRTWNWCAVGGHNQNEKWTVIFHRIKSTMKPVKM